MNKTLLIGRLTKDPELRFTQSGTAVANWTLAVNRRFANQNGEREADFINCQAWNKTAEFVAQYFKKGQPMALEGRLQVSTYEKDGTKHWKTEVVAEQIEFVGSKNDSNNNTNGGNGNNYTQNRGNDTEPMGIEVMFDDNDLPF